MCSGLSTNAPISLILFLQVRLMHLKQLTGCRELVAEKKLLKPGGWFVLEHTPRNHYEKFALYKTSRNYGTTIFSIFIEPATENNSNK